MDATMLFGLISLGLNTALQLLNVQGVTKVDYSRLAATLENAFAPLIAMIPEWLKGGTAAPAATIDILAAFGAAIGTLNALKQTPDLPADMLAKIAEYISAAQDGMTAYIKAQSGFDASQYIPVPPMPAVA